MDYNQIMSELGTLKRVSGENVYDPFYQEIKLPDGSVIPGYEAKAQYATWAAIKDLVDWKGKMVADIGCNNGFFSFEIAKLGAQVIGFDIFKDAVRIATAISELMGLKKDTLFTHTNISKDKLMGKYDVILLLNVLHHVENPIHALTEVLQKSNVVIAEVQFDGFNQGTQVGHDRMKKNMKDLTLEKVTEMALEHGFRILFKHKSARPNRTILRIER